VKGCWCCCLALALQVNCKEEKEREEVVVHLLFVLSNPRKGVEGRRLLFEKSHYSCIKP
jgi:hypothetical protein